MDMPVQLERFVERFSPRRHLTFYFYEDGTLVIKNAITDEPVALHSLNAESKDFYIQKRIAFIKNKLLNSVKK